MHVITYLLTIVILQGINHTQKLTNQKISDMILRPENFEMLTVARLWTLLQFSRGSRGGGEMNDNFLLRLSLSIKN